eukprot:14981_1
MVSNLNNLDAALGQYYKSLNRYDYEDTDGVSVFKQFCDVNGFDSDGIADEMDLPPEDCMICEFDDNFPLKQTIEHHTARISAIYKIIKYCYENGKSPTHSIETKCYALNTNNKKIQQYVNE